MPTNALASPVTRGAVVGLGAAALFGVSAPLSKLLLQDTAPTMLAGLLYGGAGLGLLAAGLLRRAPAGREAQLKLSDARLLVGILASGGVAGPLLMLWGLGRVSGVAGSLLLNLEAPLTILLAVAFFGEHLGRQVGIAAALVVVGAAALGYQPGGGGADLLGALAIAAACASWALDNNLSQRLSGRDPVAVARFKVLGAGAVNLAIAFAVGAPLPSPGIVGWGVALGVLSYGASYVLHMQALRLIGAARQAAYFATAPFLGALAALPILGERLHPLQAAALAIMGAGVVLLVRERHAHGHVHVEMEHDHAHSHDDEHHVHDHEHPAPARGTHSHPHRHVRFEHSHEHAPDAHHRHEH